MAYMIPYATEHIFYRSLVTAGSQDYQANPTIAAGDFKESRDGGTFNNLDTLPEDLPALGTQVKITLSVDETTCKKVRIEAKDVADDEWEMDSWEFETYGHASSQHPNMGYAATSIPTNEVLGED